MRTLMEMYFFFSKDCTAKKLPRWQMLFFALCAAFFMTTGTASAAPPTTPEELRVLRDSLVRTKVTPDQIPALYRPRYVESIDATLSLEDPEPVFLVPLAGGLRVYPQRIMVWHEVINEMIDGTPYCITYSPITGVATAYRSRTGSKALNFGIDGRLLYGNSVLFDRETNSLWSQIYGMAFDGPLVGKALERIPLYRTTWQYAKAALPRAKVLSYPLGSRRPYGKDPYGSYLTKGNYYDDDRLLYALPSRDKRLPLKKRVLGIDFEGIRAAIDEEAVRKAGVSNLNLGITPLVAIHDRALDIIRVFDARMWGKPATFAIKDGKLVDRETGSTWTVEGKATAGNLKDAVLTEVPATESMWFAWAAFQRDTLVLPAKDALSGL